MNIGAGERDRETYPGALAPFASIESHMSTTARRRTQLGASTSRGDPDSDRTLSARTNNVPSGNDDGVSAVSRRKQKRSRRSSVRVGIGLVVVICVMVWILERPERRSPELLPQTHRIRQGEHSVQSPQIKSSSARTNLVVHDHHQDDHAEKIMGLLYPPGLMGGYRNQVLRFVGLIVQAMKHEISQLFLPSLLWTTQVNVNDKEEWVPIPMDLVLDVEHWNQIAMSMKGTENSLPVLVDYDPGQTYDCWTRIRPEAFQTHYRNVSKLTQQVLQRGFATPIVNESIRIATRQDIVNPRKIDFYNRVENCTHPSMYGGGRGAGRLWNDMMGYLRKPSGIPYEADAKVLKALRPKDVWRDVAMQCVTSHTSGRGGNYMALHARVELEMMDHNCGKTMEKNLTKIFDMVEGFLVANRRLSKQSLSGVFVAVSRSGMEAQGRLYQKFQRLADENLQTINRIVGRHDDLGTGLSFRDLIGHDHPVSVFECGQRTMDEYYREHPDSIDYGSLLQSIVNFYIATEATAFVGVHGSSYSTDIWTTRYHQGKGDTNFEYTTEGIIPIENDGLPPPHKNCKNK